MRGKSVRAPAGDASLSDDLKLRRQLILLPVLAAPLLLLGCRQRSAPASATSVELHIQTDGDFLAFVPTDLTCPTGAHVRLFFHHAGEHVPQEHNWVLVRPGTVDEVEKAATAAGEGSGWVPQHDARVLAATSLCSPGATASVEFVAPAPGDYPFFCSFPGHGAEMRGILHVTAS
jgi:azurin